MNLTLSFCLLALYHMHFLFAIYSIYFFESSQTFGYCSHITIPRGVLAWICHNPFYEIVDRSEAVLSSPPCLLHLRGVSYSLVHGLCTCCAVYSIVNIQMKEENLSFLLTLTKKAKNRRIKWNFIKNILQAALIHGGYCLGHGLGLHLLLRQFHLPSFV